MKRSQNVPFTEKKVVSGGGRGYHTGAANWDSLGVVKKTKNARLFR